VRLPYYPPGTWGFFWFSFPGVGRNCPPGVIWGRGWGVCGLGGFGSYPFREISGLLMSCDLRGEEKCDV